MSLIIRHYNPSCTLFRTTFSRIIMSDISLGFTQVIVQRSLRVIVSATFITKQCSHHIFPLLPFKLLKEKVCVFKLFLNIYHNHIHDIPCSSSSQRI